MAFDTALDLGEPLVAEGYVGSEEGGVRRVQQVLAVELLLGLDRRLVHAQQAAGGGAQGKRIGRAAKTPASCGSPVRRWLEMSGALQHYARQSTRRRERSARASLTSMITRGIYLVLTCHPTLD
jgi:hypothetical protein